MPPNPTVNALSSPITDSLLHRVKHLPLDQTMLAHIPLLPRAGHAAYLRIRDGLALGVHEPQAARLAQVLQPPAARIAQAAPALGDGGRARHEVLHPPGARAALALGEQHGARERGHDVAVEEQLHLGLGEEHLLAGDEEVDEHLEGADAVLAAGRAVDRVGGLDAEEEHAHEVVLAQTVLDLGAACGEGGIGARQALIADHLERQAEVVAQFVGRVVSHARDRKVVAEVEEVYAGGCKGRAVAELMVDFCDKRGRLKSVGS